MKDKIKNHRFTANDVDGAYLLGVFNSGGLDRLSEEIKRLKRINLMPSEMITILNTHAETIYDKATQREL